MGTKSDDLVAEFLLSSFPALVRDAYNIIAQIKYPVGDKKSFSDQLDVLVKQLKEPQSENTSHIDMVRFVFDASDFPIQSVQSGLEKFHSKLSGRSDSRRPPGPPELTFTDHVVDRSDHGEAPIIDNLNIYRNRFRKEYCAQCAFQHYLWDLRALGRGGDAAVREFNAFWYGLHIGQRCMETLRCPSLT